MRVVVPRGDWELAKEREVTAKLRAELQALQTHPFRTPTGVDPAEVVKHAQEAYATERDSHEATKRQLEALQQRRAGLDAMSAELQRKAKLHSAQLAAAVQLEQRWRNSVRQAQHKQRELRGPEKEYGDTEEIFVCYLCQKAVHNL